MDGQETKDVGSKKILRGSKFRVEGKKIKMWLFVEFQHEYPKPKISETLKLKGKKKNPSIEKKKSVLGNIYVHFFPYEIFSENFDIT